MENNDHLMKIHKEILDQKSKMERAEREMKSSRKDATQNINDQEFLTNFDVGILVLFITPRKEIIRKISERLRSKGEGATEQYGLTAACRNG